jgi:3-methyladenine DNA glycosylase AlkD
MYDNLIEQDPKMKKMRAESEAKGELRASQRMLVKVVNARFPALAELARQQVKHIDNPDTLDLLAQKIVTAPDENTARWLLSPTAA